MFSLKVSVSGNRESLDRHEIEVQCPRCALHTWVSFGHILRKDFVVCRGCHANVLLDDHMGTARRAVREYDAAIESLFATFS